MSQYILSLDQGTTSSRAIIFNKKGEVIAVAQKEFTQIFPQSGWVEHDALEIWSSQAGVAAEATAKAGINGKNIAAMWASPIKEKRLLYGIKTQESQFTML